MMRVVTCKHCRNVLAESDSIAYVSNDKIEFLKKNCNAFTVNEMTCDKCGTVNKYCVVLQE